MKKPYSELNFKIYNISMEEKIATVCLDCADECNDPKHNHRGNGGHGGNGNHGGHGVHSAHRCAPIPNTHSIS